VGHFRSNEQLFDDSEAGRSLFYQGRIGIQHKGFRWCVSIEVSQQLTSTRQRDELVVVQIGHLGFEAWSVLNRSRHIGREVSLHPIPTLRTYLDFGSVFGDFDSYGRNIKYLPFLMAT